VKTLNLLVLRCRDVEAARRFYELLGMTFTKHRHGTGPEHYAQEDERGVFELYPAGDAPADTAGVGFGVPEVEEAFARFESAGFSPKPVRETQWGRSFVVRDPDGRRVEIKQQA